MIYSFSYLSILIFFLSFFYSSSYSNDEFSINENQKSYTKEDHIKIILNDRNFIKRRFSTQYLQFYNKKDPEILNTFLKALNDYDLKVQELAIYGIASMTIPKNRLKEVSSYLFRFIKVKNLKIKKASIKALGKIKSPYAVDAIIDELNNEDIEIQKASIQSLAEIKNKKALRSLIPKFFHPNKSIRMTSCLWIAEFEDERIIPFLEKVYEKDENIKVRQLASLALRKYGRIKKFPKIKKQ